MVVSPRLLHANSVRQRNHERVLNCSIVSLAVRNCALVCPGHTKIIARL